MGYNLNFSQALDLLKSGNAVRRRDWRGKRMWISYGKGNQALEAEKFWNPHTKAFAEDNGGFAEVLPYIIMKTEDNKIQMGWAPSQADILADDWELAV